MVRFLLSYIALYNIALYLLSSLYTHTAKSCGGIFRDWRFEFEYEYHGWDGWMGVCPGWTCHWITIGSFCSFLICSVLLLLFS